MLTQISIRNLAIAESVELEFNAGMTAITGETGAGKSISLDAIGLAIGDRADSSWVRHGCDRAEVNACFDISSIAAAQSWLEKRDLLSTDECILRRVISKEGRSKTYINGSPMTLKDAKAIGEILIDIHSQHEHQSLLKREQQQQLLDAFGGCETLSLSVRKASQLWHQQNQLLTKLRDSNAENNAREQLLKYQLQEFAEAELVDGELEGLEQEQKRLSQADDNLHKSHQALSLCSNDNGDAISDLLHRAAQFLAPIADSGQACKEALELITSAQVQIEEAASSIDRHISQFDVSPERLETISSRLDQLYRLAQKHRIQAYQLLDFQAGIEEELASLDCSEARLDELSEELSALFENYQQQASKLSKSRHKAAKALSKKIAGYLAELGMQHCRFEVNFEPRNHNEPHHHGLESLEFLIAPNPGQPAQSLAKIASGGELSRISLAIQVATAETAGSSTLAFDEVDVGIGGSTAEIVGKLLRSLSSHKQVITVTHQAQVAAQAHQHLYVSKKTDKQSTSTFVSQLEGKDRQQEIARMIGGIEITTTTLEHAKEMLQKT